MGIRGLVLSIPRWRAWKCRRLKSRGLSLSPPLTKPELTLGSTRAWEAAQGGKTCLENFPTPLICWLTPSSRTSAGLSSSHLHSSYPNQCFLPFSWSFKAFLCWLAGWGCVIPLQLPQDVWTAYQQRGEPCQNVQRQQSWWTTEFKDAVELTEELWRSEAFHGM